MLTKKICIKGRGEGKTKWLIQKALAALDAGNTNVYYTGSLVGYNRFCKSFERETGEKCKIGLLDSTHYNVLHDTIYLTDELLNELTSVQYGLMEVVGGTWYATLGKENTIEE